MRILVVEDDASLADVVARALREAGWAPDVVSNGRAALDALSVTDYDLAVLDLSLPDADGLDVCRRWRLRGGSTPVLILTARGGIADRVAGLDAGADDYLAKPFAVPELLARLRALARRPRETLEPTLRFADLELDPATRSARRNGRSVMLSAREYALLEYLLRHPGRVLDRARILAHVWDDAFEPVGNVVDVLVGRVRRKVDPDGAVPLIHTVRGLGYVLALRPPGDA